MKQEEKITGRQEWIVGSALYQFHPPGGHIGGNQHGHMVRSIVLAEPSVTTGPLLQSLLPCGVAGYHTGSA